MYQSVTTVVFQCSSIWSGNTEVTKALFWLLGKLEDDRTDDSVLHNFINNSSSVALLGRWERNLKNPSDFERYKVPVPLHDNLKSQAHMHGFNVINAIYNDVMLTSLYLGPYRVITDDAQNEHASVMMFVVGPSASNKTASHRAMRQVTEKV